MWLGGCVGGRPWFLWSLVLFCGRSGDSCGCRECHCLQAGEREKRGGHLRGRGGYMRPMALPTHTQASPEDKYNRGSNVGAPLPSRGGYMRLQRVYRVEIRKNGGGLGT